MALIRLDKLLAQSGERTRSEATRQIRAGLVTVAGVSITNPATKVDPDAGAVLLNGCPVCNEPHQYFMLHKPAGILTAARDARAQTVMALLPQALLRRDVLPVGRLDKDTTGLLLLTNDGVLAHRLLTPKRHVWKEYLATLDGPLGDADVAAFAQGITLTDFVAMPAQLEILTSSAQESRALVRVSEGKYHQVKRMFAARGRQVLTLHREAFGPLRLDIPIGENRPLRGDEIAALRAVAQETEPREGSNG